MKNSAFVASILFLGVWSAFAQIIVHDPGIAFQNQINETANYLKWAEQAVSEANTATNTLETYENTVLQVERMGDPKTLTANLPGVSNLQTLSAIYQQGMKDVSDMASYANPQSWKITADQVLNTYQQPVIQTVTMPNGQVLQNPQSVFQFETANYNNAYTAQQTVASLNQKLQSQTQELAEATAALQASTTTSDVQKYAGVIAGLQGAIESTKASLQQEELSNKLQVQQNNAAGQLTRNQQAQTIQAADAQAIDQGLSGLPLGTLDHQVRWTQP